LTERRASSVAARRSVAPRLVKRASRTHARSRAMPGLRTCALGSAAMPLEVAAVLAVAWAKVPGSIAPARMAAGWTKKKFLGGSAPKPLLGTKQGAPSVLIYQRHGWPPTRAGTVARGA